jgi:hypothetical protein
MAKITMTVLLPDELLQPFLQHVRNFEAPRTEKVPRLWITESTLTINQIAALFRSVRPEYPETFFAKPEDN